MELYGDFSTTLKDALSEIDENWRDYDGLIIAGTHTPHSHDIEKLIDKIKHARENKRPFLGICWGHQLAAIEHARNVVGIKDATSEEWSKTGTHVVKKRGALNVGEVNGQSFWNNYEVVFTWKNPKHFFTSQYHPEYESTIKKPHKMLVNFIKLCKKAPLL